MEIREGSEENPEYGDNADLESKIVGNTMNTWQVLLIKWRKNILRGKAVG